MPRTLTTALILGILLLPSIAPARAVVYNTKTGKYHAPSCPAAKHCTVNCVEMSLKDAKAAGGVPCKKCGGGGG